ncbi:MAG: PEP-CTERM sorting domain-containing protein [Phycisphaeraceae bacterium]
MKIKTPLLLTALGAGLLAGQTQAQIAGAIRPGDDLGGLNLVSYTNPWQATVAGFEFDSFFSSGADGFNIYKRGTSQSVPFALADDSISVFPTDSQGIIDENDTDPFFGIVDTWNIDTENPPTDGNTGPYDPVTATWVFDISSATADVEVTIDLAAMGDFEADDSFTFSVGLDAGPVSQVGALTFLDTDGGTTLPGVDYTLANGTTVTTLDDPMQFNGTTLTNVFATFSLGTIAGSASASTLTLELSANANGGSEAVALRNIIIDEPGTVLPGDTDGDGDIDDSDLGTAFSNYTGPLAPGTGGKTAADGDTDGDGDVDDSDLGTAFSGYTGPLSAPVPEPTSLALIGLGGLALVRRRRA